MRVRVCACVWASDFLREGFIQASGPLFLRRVSDFTAEHSWLSMQDAGRMWIGSRGVVGLTVGLSGHHFHVGLHSEHLVMALNVPYKSDKPHTCSARSLLFHLRNCPQAF